MIRVLALATVLGLAGSILPAQDMPDLDDIVQVRLISGWQTPSGAHMGALQVTLAQGWKTYWRVGGETGIPPRFNWQDSVNLSGVEIHWPRPDVLSVGGVDVIGYKNELVLPIEFTPDDHGQKIHVSAVLEMGVCRDICIPVQMPISVRLDDNDGKDRFLIELALADGATSALQAGIAPAKCNVRKVEDGFKVTADIKLPADINPPDAVVFETRNQEIWVTQSVFSLKDGVLESEALFLSYSDQNFSLSSDDIRITLISDTHALDFQGCDIR